MTSYHAPYPTSHLPSPPASVASPYMLQGVLDRVRRSTHRTFVGLDETARLQLLHVAHTAVLDPSHTQMIEQHLASVHAAGRRSRVLDVGAVSPLQRLITHTDKDAGTWAINLANTQPYADVTAVDWDWSWFRPADSCHGNLDFQTIDVTQTLPFQPGSVDLIHVKCLLLSLPQYEALIERLAVVLRPGGMLILVESELGYSSTQEPMSQEMRTWNACLRELMDSRGVDYSLATRLVPFIGSSGVFSSAVYHQVGALKGVSAAAGDVESLACTGRLHRDLLSTCLDRQMAELVAFGYGQDVLWPIRQTVLAELTDPYSPHCQRIFAAYATKLAH